MDDYNIITEEFCNRMRLKMFYNKDGIREFFQIFFNCRFFFKNNEISFSHSLTPMNFDMNKILDIHGPFSDDEWKYMRYIFQYVKEGHEENPVEQEVWNKILSNCDIIMDFYHCNGGHSTKAAK
jgi:hypothetical protein